MSIEDWARLGRNYIKAVDDLFRKKNRQEEKMEPEKIISRNRRRKGKEFYRIICEQAENLQEKVEENIRRYIDDPVTLGLLSNLYSNLKHGIGVSTISYHHDELYNSSLKISIHYDISPIEIIVTHKYHNGCIPPRDSIHIQAFYSPNSEKQRLLAIYYCSNEDRDLHIEENLPSEGAVERIIKTFKDSWDDSWKKHAPMP